MLAWLLITVSGVALWGLVVWWRTYSLEKEQRKDPGVMWPSLLWPAVLVLFVAALPALVPWAILHLIGSWLTGQYRRPWRCNIGFHDFTSPYTAFCRRCPVLDTSPGDS